MKTISQRQAREQGLTRFFTGKPCVKGHVAPRQTSNFRCVECGFLKSRAYERAHPEIKNAANRRQYNAIKMQVITALGSKCACRGCSETMTEFMCIDHKNGGGGRHRREFGSVVILRSIRTRILTEGVRAVSQDYQILCWNCNSAKHIYGQCPHVKRKR